MSPKESFLLESGTLDYIQQSLDKIKALDIILSFHA